MGILEIRSGQMLWGSVHADPDCALSTGALGTKVVARTCRSDSSCDQTIAAGV